MIAEAIDIAADTLTEMDRMLLDSQGRLVMMPACAYSVFPDDHLRAWCATRARYGLPTKELIGWLLIRIAGRSAIEIGAGMGDLGHRLGIPMTDSYQQVTDEATMMAFDLAGLKPTNPPSDVVKMDAQTAVLHYKPKVVVGSWITQRWLPGDANGNMHGPREEVILKNCDCYIVIGNENIHGDKRIMDQPHQTFHFPWLISRAKDQSKNVIYMWGN